MLTAIHHPPRITVRDTSGEAPALIINHPDGTATAAPVYPLRALALAEELTAAARRALVPDPERHHPQHLPRSNNLQELTMSRNLERRLKSLETIAAHVVGDVRNFTDDELERCIDLILTKAQRPLTDEERDELASYERRLGPVPRDIAELPDELLNRSICDALNQADSLSDDPA